MDIDEHVIKTGTNLLVSTEFRTSELNGLFTYHSVIIIFKHLTCHK